jgi:hypothetical protein
MRVRGSGWLLAAVLVAHVAIVGCEARQLDPGANPTTGTGGQAGGRPISPPPPEIDLASMLKQVSGPDQLLILGVSGGAVTSVSTRGPVYPFVGDPEALDEAAAVVGMRVCSVEFQQLTLGPPGDVSTLAVSDALDMCLKEDLGDMPARLASLRTPSTVVVVAPNTAITIHSTNNGVNAFYDTDIVRLLHAARELYVPVCFVTTGQLAGPTPDGQSAGVSIEDALAACGRM